VSETAEALEAVERALAEGGDADEVLREVVAALHEHLGRFVRISFVERDRLEPGPAAGAAGAGATASFPITWAGRLVAQLEVEGGTEAGERELLDRVATLVAPHALVGWDTGGEAWTP
jgi:hypothetical protein